MVRAILDGEALTGTWFDPTKEYGARLRGESFTRYEHTEQETVVLSPLPCWRRLSAEQYRERVAGLVQQIEAARRELWGPTRSLWRHSGRLRRS